MLLLLAACNVLTGSDGLSTRPAGEAQPELASPIPSTSGASGSSGTSGASGPTARDHAPAPDASSSGSPGTSDAAPDDAGTSVDAGPPAFADDFQRPNGTLGNGWITKTAGTFSLVNGAAQQSQTGIYRNLFVSRPSAENVRDVLVQATVTFPTMTSDPCLFARIQAGSDVKDRFLGYSVYPDGANNLYVSRDDGAAFTDMGASLITPPLVAGAQYRLSLQVTGDTPVHLVGSIAKTDGTVLATITANDGSAQRFVTAGSVGFGSSVAMNGRWDDVRVRLLP